MEPQEKVEWKYIYDLRKNTNFLIDSLNDLKLQLALIKEDQCFKRNKEIFNNRPLYRIIEIKNREINSGFIIKIDDKYHTGYYDGSSTAIIGNRKYQLSFLAKCSNIYLISRENIETKENMKTKEIKINIPNGYEIDKENSTFDCIKFKPIVRCWRNTVDEHAIVKGWFIGFCGNLMEVKDAEKRNKLFATEKQAKSALAMAQISQIMANDERFGGVVTDKEWKDDSISKYCIERYNNCIGINEYYKYYCFFAFHKAEQAKLFLEENKDLVMDYLMMD